MDKLASAFPELGASMVGDILSQVAGDVEAARRMLAGMVSREPSQTSIERMLAELAPFQELGKEVILDTLRLCDWDVDRAMLPLFGKLEERSLEEKAKRYEEEKRERERKEKEARAEANRYLRQIFSAVPEQTIQEILDANGGDVDQATEEVLKILEKEKAEMAERERKHTLDQLVGRFNFSTEETEEVLVAKNWVLEEAVKELLQRDNLRRIQSFKTMFPDLSEEEIIDTIDAHSGSSHFQIQVALVHFLKEKKRKQEEEEERIRREAEERARAEEQRRIEEERARHDAEARAEFERLTRELEEKQKREEEERAKAEALEAARKEKEAKEKQEARVHIRMEESMRIVRELISEAATVNVEAIVRKELEDKMRGGSDEMPAFLDKDKGAAKVADKVVLDVSVKKEDKPAPAAPPPPADLEASQQVARDVVKIKIVNDRIDFGKAVVVEWEHSAEPMSSDWIALFNYGSSGRNYITYEWISQKKGTISFSAPMACTKVYACYFTNGTYESYGISNFADVGPTYDLIAKVEGDNIIVIPSQTFGAPNPHAWIALYTSPASALGDYYTYQWIGDRKEVPFAIPKAGDWHFKLFPQKLLQPVATCDITVGGEDKLSLSVVDNSCIVTYSINTLDLNRDDVWVGLYDVSEGDNKRYRRAHKIPCREGKFETKKMIHKGTYEARLFAKRTYEVRGRSNSLEIDGILW